MKIIITSSCKKSIKRLNAADKKTLDKGVKAIAADPGIGDPKKGDLSGVYTVAFKFQGAQHRLAYQFTKTELTLLAFGSRENFYKRLKR